MMAVKKKPAEKQKPVPLKDVVQRLLETPPRSDKNQSANKRHIKQ